MDLVLTTAQIDDLFSNLEEVFLDSLNEDLIIDGTEENEEGMYLGQLFLTICETVSFSFCAYELNSKSNHL